MSQLDDLLTQLGTGRWTILHILVICYWFSLLSYHTLGGAFLAPKVDFACRPPAASAHARATNDSCAYFEEDPSTGRVEERPCAEWDFDNSTFTSTVTSEFGLVCEREYLRATYQSIYMLGIFVGAPLNGVMADRFGRLPMVSASSVVYTGIAIGSCFLYSLPLLLAARFLLGVMHPASLQTGYILVMEMAEPRWRSALGVGMFLPWALGTMAWGGFAYLVRAWRWLQLAVSLPCLLFLPALLVLDESPRWLAVAGRQEKALGILKKAAERNRVDLPSDEKILSILKDDQRKDAPAAHHHLRHVHRLPRGGAGVLRPLPRRRDPQRRPLPLHGSLGARGGAGQHRRRPRHRALRQADAQHLLLRGERRRAPGAALHALRPRMGGGEPGDGGQDEHHLHLQHPFPVRLRGLPDGGPDAGHGHLPHDVSNRSHGGPVRHGVHGFRLPLGSFCGIWCVFCGGWTGNAGAARDARRSTP
ncbi:organic cation transporter protein-like isoform X4 [Penaeus vannamei]|uniref:organic cation transporter protein-like isoform X4 n=1 Tax=Penaeus vannamei TaxID=6689 RepID=UPI00387F6329